MRANIRIVQRPPVCGILVQYKRSQRIQAISGVLSVRGHILSQLTQPSTLQTELAPHWKYLHRVDR